MKADYDEQFYNLDQHSQTKVISPKMGSVKSEPKTRESHFHTKLIIYAVIGILLYYVGSFLIVFVRYDYNGVVASVPAKEISWRLAFDNFPVLLRNFYDNFFGYFSRYSSLYQQGTTFLIPVDIGIKLITIFYFILYWIPWDTKRAYRYGYFGDDYPYISEEYKEEFEELELQLDDSHPKEKLRESTISSSLASSLSDSSTGNTGSVNITNQQSLSLYPNYELNPYLRAQILKNQKPASNANVNQAQKQIDPEDLDDDDEDDEEPGLMPFSGVEKPLEELYQRYERTIYDLIRRRILPGSNILLVGYFSTLFIIDLATPITVVLYILGVMSMFWCMQSFLLVIDHLQFPPEND